MMSRRLVTAGRSVSTLCLFGFLMSFHFVTTAAASGPDLAVSIIGGPSFEVAQSIPTDPDIINIPPGDMEPLLIHATLTNNGPETFVGIPDQTLFITAAGDPFFLSGATGIVGGQTVNEGDGLRDLVASHPFVGGFTLEPGETKEFVLHLIEGMLCPGCGSLPGPVLEPAPCGATLTLLESSFDLRFGELVDGIVVADPNIVPELRLFAEGPFPLMVTVTCADSDGDGIPDAEDDCPDSELSATVVLDDCDSGVENVLFDNGCTTVDLLLDGVEEMTNHGQFASQVAHVTNELKKAGIISGAEKGKIMKCSN